MALFHTIVLSRGDIFPDGKYSQRILDHATQAAISDFDLSVQMISETTPVDIYALNESFDMVKSSIAGIDMEKIKMPLVLNLLTEFAKRSIRHLLTEPTSQEQRRTLKSFAHSAKVLVYDCSRLKLKIPPKHALKLFEIIYRYAEDGYRYQCAFAKLFESIDIENMALFFEKLEKFFDPMRPRILTFTCSNYKYTDEVYNRFSQFIRTMYKRVNTFVDPSTQASIYNNHMNSIISSLLMDSRGEAFLDIFTDVLPRVDKILLFKSSHFYENLSKFISEGIKTDSPILHILIDNFMTNETIAAVTEDMYVKFGSILAKMASDQHSLSDRILLKIRALTLEMKTKLNGIRHAFNNYDMMLNRANSLSFLKLTFKSSNKTSLLILSQEIFELTNYVPVLVKNKQKVNENGHVLFKELVEIALNDPVITELNTERFTVLFSFLSYCIKTGVPYSKIYDPFILLIKYYNSHVEMKNSHQYLIKIFKTFLQSLVDASVFPKAVEDYKIIYGILAKDCDEYIALMKLSEFIGLLLKNSQEIKETIDLIQQIETELEISLHVVLISHLSEEIKLFYEIPANENKRISIYKNGYLRTFINELIRRRLLSRAETELLDSFKLRNK